MEPCTRIHMHARKVRPPICTQGVFDMHHTEIFIQRYTIQMYIILHQSHQPKLTTVNGKGQRRKNTSIHFFTNSPSKNNRKPWGGGSGHPFNVETWKGESDPPLRPRMRKGQDFCFYGRQRPKNCWKILICL